MPDASWTQTSFLGGEWSKTAQGRFDDPAYSIALNVCLNMIPMESGALTRRPGTQFAQTTRNGAPGRVVGFNFAQATPYTMEFTDGHLRFRQGTTLIDTNDTVAVSSISIDNPAIMTLASAVTWATGDQGYFTGLGTSCPLLQNRVFTVTLVDTTHFSLTDPIGGATIDGSTLGVATLAATAKFHRVLDIATPWTSGSWANLRAVLADLPVPQNAVPGAVMLNPSVAPYVLQVATLPRANANATFSFNPVNFKDGPYFDPFVNGVQANPNQKSGIVLVTLSFPAYDATKAYTTGDFVNFTAINYRSLVDQNVGNTPNTSPSQWQPVSAGLAVGPNGFQGSDIGRLVRLFSEPDIWVAGTSYSLNQVVSYNPSGIPGAAGYWSSLVNTNVGNIPGTDTSHWTIATNAAQWTWGKITGLGNQISQTLAGSVNFGTMTGNGGVAASFDGITNQNSAASSAENDAISGDITQVFQFHSSIGKNYSGASAQAIYSATIYPSSNGGFAPAVAEIIRSTPCIWNASITINLRAKATAPASGSDGTLLGTSGLIANTVAPVTIVSSDAVTTWNYVWFEIVTTWTNNQAGSGLGPPTPVTLSIYSAEAQFFNPPGTGSGNAISVEILGPPLLYTTPIRTWRLGLYSNTTGWPTAGTFHEGRLWLAGVVNNRIDSSRSNDPFNFAPTDQFGSVPSNAAISYLLNSPDTNPVFWMDPDDRGIIVGTLAAEWLITATTQNLSLSPTNVQAHRVTRHGVANIEPRRAGQTIVFVQRFGRKLLEYFADVFSGRLAAPNLTRDSKHLTQNYLKELAYQNELVPIVWGRRGDGGLVGWTYKRENMMSSQGPSFIAGHRHTLGSGRVVESICTGPSSDGNLDTLTLVTNDPTTGVRHVEVLTNMWEEGNALTTAWYLDDAVAPSYTYDLNALTLTLNGLWHLNGKTVTAFVTGLDAGDYTVANGSITVPLNGSANSIDQTSMVTVANLQPYLAALPAVVGFTYNSDGQVLRPGPQKDSGAANGPAFGKVSRTHQIAVDLVDTVGGMFGSAGVGVAFGSAFTSPMNWPALPRTPNQTIYTANTLFNGVLWTPLEQPYTFDDGQLCWRISRPYPATIAAISAFRHTQDR